MLFLHLQTQMYYLRTTLDFPFIRVNKFIILCIIYIKLKLGLLPWGRNMGWRCSRTRCWWEYSMGL